MIEGIARLRGRPVIVTTLHATSWLLWPINSGGAGAIVLCRLLQAVVKMIVNGSSNKYLCVGLATVTVFVIKVNIGNCTIFLVIQ